MAALVIIVVAGARFDRREWNWSGSEIVGMMVTAANENSFFFLENVRHFNSVFKFNCS